MSNRYFGLVSLIPEKTIVDIEPFFTYLPILFHCSNVATAVAFGFCSESSIASENEPNRQNGEICFSIRSQTSGLRSVGSSS